MKSRKAIMIRLILPLFIATFACTIYIPPADESNSGQRKIFLTDPGTKTPTAITAQSTLQTFVPTETLLPPTLTHTPVTPTPTLTPTPAVLGIEIIPASEIQNRDENRDSAATIGIKSEVFFESSGDAFGMPYCTLPDGWTFPTVGFGGWGYRFIDGFDLCLVGFPFDQTIDVSVYAPDGSFVSATSLSVQGENLLKENEVDGPSEFDNSIFSSFFLEQDDGSIRAIPYSENMFGSPSGEKVDETFVFVDFSFPPVGYPIGDWKFSFEYGNETIEYYLYLEPQSVDYLDFSRSAWKTKKQNISILTSPYLDPLENFRRDYFQGETLYFIGIGYQPNTDVPVGIYRETGERKANPYGEIGSVYTLIYGTMVTTDSSGHFWFPFEITPEVELGYYYAVDFSNPDIQVFDSFAERSFIIARAKP